MNLSSIKTGYHKLLWLAFFPIILVGCETVLEFPAEPETDPVPVIEAIITDNFEVQKVRVTWSASLNDSSSAIEIPDADVCVFSAAMDTIHFTYYTNGWFFSDSCRAKDGETYTLQIKIDTLTIRSTATLIPMHGIDTLKCRYYKKSNDHDSLYYIYLDAGKTDSFNIKYYQLELTRNGKPVTRGSEIWLMNDQYLTTLNDIELPAEFQAGDTIDVTLYSLSKTMFDYYYTLVNDVYNFNLANIGYKTNPPIMFDRRAMGYFQLSAVSSKRIIVH